jgi:hypothetical protein
MNDEITKKKIINKITEKKNLQSWDKTQQKRKELKPND